MFANSQQSTSQSYQQPTEDSQILLKKGESQWKCLQVLQQIKMRNQRIRLEIIQFKKSNEEWNSSHPDTSLLQFVNTLLVDNEQLIRIINIQKN